MRINVKCPLLITANDVDSALRSVTEEAKVMFGKYAETSHFIVDVEGKYVRVNDGTVELAFSATASFGVNVPGTTAFEEAMLSAGGVTWVDEATDYRHGLTD